MASFSCLEGLAVAANSRSLFDRMMLYFERETSIGFDFVTDLHNLWVQFIDCTNDRKLFISELDGLPPSVMSYNCCRFLHQLQENDFIKLLELRKLIAETYSELHKKLGFVSVMKNIQISKVDPPVGLFVGHKRSLFESDFVLLDPRLRSKKSAMDRSFTLGSTEEVDNYKKLPRPDCSLDNSPYYSSAGLRIAFDPTKSPHYKLVNAGRTFYDIDIQIFSSEIGKWSLCSDRFNYFSFDYFNSAIYWNDGLHWLETENRQLMHYILNIEDPDHLIITTIPILQRDDFGSREFTIYEMTIGCSVWMVREQDSFLVIKLSGKVIQYNLISKSLHEIYDCGSNQVDDNHDDNDDAAADDDELLQQFHAEHSVYEFIPSFASPSLLAPLRKLTMLRSCSLAMVCFCVVVQDCLFLITAGLRIAFDPTKIPHYKLVDAGRTFCDIDVQIYSSEIGKWSLCSDRFNYFSFDHFDSAIYWNDGLHWLETENRQLMHYNLNIEDPDHPIITTENCLSGMGLCLDDFGSREFTIYKMTIGCSVWMVRYRVHTDDFMTPFPEGWSIRSNVWSTVLGEREQDSFLVIKLSGKVVQYNLISKTLHEIYDCVFNQVDDNHDDNDDDDDDDDDAELLQQFQTEHNVYEFISSFASNGYVKSGQKQSKTDKTEHGNGKKIAEEEGLLKFLRDRCDDLRRKNARRRVLIHEMKALGERVVAVDSLESLKQTHARETAKLAALTDTIAESLAGIHEKERHVTKLDLND
nr:hypothetical protein [Tanacetum cinerariifolium]